MKKYIYSTLISVSLLGGMTSCDDIFDTSRPSASESALIFSRYENTKGAIAGIYQSLFEQNAYRGRVIPFYGYNTDIEWYNTHYTVANDRHDLHAYLTKSNNTQFNASESKDPWSKIYEAIERANLAIDGLHTYGNVENDKDMAQLLGEVYCLRAMLYNDLTNIWGDVPARFLPLGKDEFYKPRESRDVIYKQCILDLQTAADLLHWPNEHERTSIVENPSKTFAKGLLARMALKAAGYSQRNDNGVSVIRKYNGDDALLQERNLYQLAYDACTDVINSGANRLENDFEQVFRKLAEDVITAGGESIYELPFSNEGPRGRNFYTFAVRHTAKNQFQQSGDRGGQAGPTPTVFYDFNVNDIRRDITCVNYQWTGAEAVQELKNVNTWYFGKYRYEWAKRMVTSTNDDGFNFIYMRYSDLYLMAAEAANYLEGPQAAVPFMQKIRERAFAPSTWNVNVTEYLQNRAVSKEEMFEAIVDERAYEFCGEMLRKTDLIRWNRLKTNLDIAKEKMYRLRDLQGEYSDLPKKIHYRYSESNPSILEFYGLNYGEHDDKSDEYTTVTDYITDTKIKDSDIESLYLANPDENQFFPVFDCIITAGNGVVENDPWHN